MSEALLNVALNKFYVILVMHMSVKVGCR